MKTTRRRFMQFGGAAAFNLVPSRLSSGRRASAGTVRLGVVGLGGSGRRHLDALLALDDATVCAVCDADPAKAEEAARRAVDARSGRCGCGGYSDYRELCARPDLDAVVVAVPDYLHARIALEAIACGKDVFGETPFARTHAEGLALAAAVARGRRVWQTGNEQRADPRFRRAVAAVCGGALGRVARVEVGLPGGGRGPLRAAASGGVPDHHWRWVRAWGGGALADGIGRYGDTALWGAGIGEEPVSVSGVGDYPNDGLYDTATSFRFTCVYRDGVEVEVADGGRLEKGVGVRWIGCGGAWIWVTEGALEASDGALLEAVRTLPLPPCTDLHRDFVACVRTRRETMAPAGAARLAAALAQAGERAMRG